MKIVSYVHGPAPDPKVEMLAHRKQMGEGGVLVSDKIYDLSQFCAWARETKNVPLDISARPNKVQDFLALDNGLRQALCDLAHLLPNSGLTPISITDVHIRAPLEMPPSVRDFYAFEQHVKTARANRGVAMLPDWYKFPVFYFSNHRAIYGPEDYIPYPRQSNALDIELEIACVIGKAGRDIPASEASSHIAGYMIMNDWSARDLQMDEMKMNMGPAKGKDFATSLGPWLVTPDELADRKIGQGEEERYNLAMLARLNGTEISRGNFKDIYFSFAQIIERASLNAWLQPGDVIGSGTVGTGCLLELGDKRERWLQPGDVVELEIERLGVLRNYVVEGAK